MSARYDVVVVGAGPAGLACAIEARRHGLSVLVLDEQPTPGGQIWRNIEAIAARGHALDEDQRHGVDALRAFHASGANSAFDATVWSVDPDGFVAWSRAGTATRARGERIVLATGALERALPIPGWTLPGVMTVGAAQILLKTAGLIPSARVWLAGQGPLLQLYATQALAAGAPLVGIVDLQPATALGDALRRLPRALARARDLARGIAWMRTLGRSGIKWLSATSLAAEGDGRLERIVFVAGKRERREPADLLLLHDGVVPNLQITRALGHAHRWIDAQRCFVPELDAWGRSSDERIYVAGDGAGIAGANAARESGRIAALAIAAALGRIDLAARDRLAAPIRRAQARHLALRPFLDALFPPLRNAPTDDTIICRCEDVSAGTLRGAVRLGCLGMNQLKSLTRCGMGPCQGRICGLQVAETLAAARGVSPAAIDFFRQRFPIKPLALGELAAMDESK